MWCIWATVYNTDGLCLLCIYMAVGRDLGAVYQGDVVIYVQSSLGSTQLSISGIKSTQTHTQIHYNTWIYFPSNHSVCTILSNLPPPI